jgi:glucose dehydrogenase
VVRGSVTETSLAVLDLTDPSIPSEAKDALKRAAAVHPEIFTQQTQGSVVRVSRWVRFEAGAVFINDRRAVELDHVIERVDRNDVAEISAPHRATKQGMVWGALLGAGIGLAVAHENYVAPVGFPVVGMVWGAGVGFLIKTSTVVYRAP